MGRYSNTGLAHGTNGSPQITMEENIYNIKIAQIYDDLKTISTDIGNQNDKKILGSGYVEPKEKKHRKRNILFEIIQLILKHGYKKLNINGIEMYKKNDIIIKVSFVSECDYYILEKADSYEDAISNYFKLLDSISNELNQRDILRILERILYSIEI